MIAPKDWNLPLMHQIEIREESCGILLNKYRYKFCDHGIIKVLSINVVNMKDKT